MGGGFCGGCCGYWFWGEARLWWWLAVTSRGLRKMERQWERERERDKGRVRNNNKNEKKY